MKKIVIISIFLLSLIGIYNIKPIYVYLDVNYINKDQFILEENGVNNGYVMDIDQNFVSMTNSFIVNSKQDILNVLYTSLNYGWEQVSFYCSESYKECYPDLNKLLKENYEVAIINELVHPYHHYSKMTINKNELGKVTIKYDLIYTKNMVAETESRIESIIKENGFLTATGDSNTQLIKELHDYVVNYSSYSTENEDDKTAYGLLKNKLGNCRGYTETMLILFYHLNIKSVPLSNGHHVWNLVYNDLEWSHLDATWDDPTAPDGKEVLTDKYFLISSSRLETLDQSGDHVYDKEFYNENNFLKIK